MRREEWYLIYLPEREPFEEWLLRYKGERVDTGCTPDGMYIDPYIWSMFAAWVAAKKQAEKSVWISVEDERPETETTVLVYTERGDIFTSWASDVDVFWFYGEEEDDRVTHWQPLPLPPTANPAA